MSQGIEYWDAVIIGGGPAGSTVAWKMVQAGWNPLVLDRALFPREKLCAGWITPSVVDSLQMDLKEYQESCTVQEFHGFRASRVSGKEVLADYRDIISYGIIRSEFDQYLLHRSGAVVREGTPLTRLKRTEGEWLLNGTIRTRLLIGAGGHFCPVARFLGADLKKEKKLSTLELEWPLSDEEIDYYPVDGLYPELVYFDDIRGYGWMFRKGRFLNIGIGRTQNRGLRRHLELFLRTMERRGKVPVVRSFKMTDFRGHPYKLHFVTPRKKFDDGVLLIGDAAGLTFNYSGEGIRPAVESALMAWETVQACDSDFSAARLGEYQERLFSAYGKPVTGWRFRFMESLPPGCFQTIGRILFRFPYLTRNIFVDRLFLRRHLPAFQAQLRDDEGETGGSADFPEAVVLPIEDSLDLHTFAPREIPEVVKEYLKQVHEKGFEEVRIIHGRGIGVQRDRVRRLLDGHPLVVNFADAPPERGGWGATVVRLKVGVRS